jgi:signal transduction histidine kinase
MHYRTVFRGWGDIPERIDRVFSTRDGYGRVSFSTDRDPAMTHFEIGLFPIGPEAEQGITVTLRNETEKEKLREEMVRLDRLASLGRLSAGIAHEVRNPLTGVSLLLDDLHDRPAAAPGERELIEKALAEIARVERLMNALLSYASPVRTNLVYGDINQVVTDTVFLMRRPCERQQVELLPETGPIPAFSFDPEKIKQALLNIVRNALEAIPDGGVVRIQTATSHGFAVISIRDSGPGISPEDLPLIFEPFFTRKGAGTGLGLSITQRIVEEHHGRIHVESTPGQGSLFTIELPLHETALQR